MRLTTLLLAASTLSLVACVADVGGGTTGRGGRGSGSDTTDGPCEEVEEAVTIRTESDFDELPNGCWDLFAPLTIQGSEITSLAKLGNLAGVNHLSLIGTNLTAVDTAKPLKVFGPVTVDGNEKLANLKNVVVEKADNIDFDLVIEDNAALVSLDGVADVTILDGDLFINNNPKLATAPLKKLKAIGGAVRITNNAALTTIDLTAVANLKRVEISTNASLTTLSGLAAAQIDGDLIIRGNAKLASLGAMSSLGTITGSLMIDDNDMLPNIAAFTTSMQYVTGILTISNNANLTNLGQVSHMLGIGAITITNNTNLSTCAAQEVDRCVNQHGLVTINGNKSASNCPTTWCGR
ncbi:MAG: hypothetical protein ABI867_03470 [Kofleriaceae bacterium]